VLCVCACVCVCVRAVYRCGCACYWFAYVCDVCAREFVNEELCGYARRCV